MPKRLLLMLAALLAVALAGCGKNENSARAKSERGEVIVSYLKLEELDNLEAGKRKDIKDNFARYRDETIVILRRRLRAMRIPYDRVAPSGERGIVVRMTIPKRKDGRMLNNLFIVGRLEFRLVHERNEELVERNLAEFCRACRGEDDADKLKELAYLRSKAPAGYECMSVVHVYNINKPLRYYYVSKEIEMDGRNIKTARPDKDQWGIPMITLSFDTKGAEDFADVTRRNVGRQLAIVLDGRLYCVPYIREAITGGSASIRRSFTEDEIKTTAEDEIKTIAAALTGGTLPLKVTVENVEKTLTSPEKPGFLP